MAMAEGQPDRGLKLDAIRVLAAIQHESGYPDRSVATLDKAIPLIQDCADPHRLSRFYLVKGWLAYLRGDLEEALKATLTSLEGTNKTDQATCWAQNNLGLIYRALGFPDKALQCYRVTRGLSKELNLAVTEGAALINICHLHFDQKDFMAALDAAQQAQLCLQEDSDEFMKTTLHGHLFDIYLARGQLTDAEASCVALSRLREETAMGRVATLTRQGRLEAVRGNYPEAERILNRAARLAQRSALYDPLIQIRYERALLRESQGRSAIALKMLNDALQLSERVGQRSRELVLLETAARITESRRQYRKTVEYLRRLRQCEHDLAQQTAEHQRILFSVELGLEKLRSEIEHERQNRVRLEDQASRDGMTGLFHHETLIKFLKSWISEGETSLILLDVDDFKNYNDFFGHLAGDLVLKNLASILVAKVRDGDLVFRYGGEEFAVIIRGEECKFSHELGERLRKSVEASTFPNREITISVGVATGTLGSSVEELINRADQALYAAKRAGRNRVVSAGETIVD